MSSSSSTTWSRSPKGAEETGRAMWHRRVEDCAERPFLTADGHTWTYAEADVAMRRLATGLRGLGVGMGTRVVVGMDNSAEAVFVHIALRELGALMIALVPGLGGGDLGWQIGHSSGEVLIADGAVAKVIAPLLSDLSQLRQIVLRDPVDDVSGPASVSSLEALGAHEPLISGELPGYDDLSPSVVFYTSGSTARPKGVVLCAGAIVTCGKGYADTFDVRREDTYLLPFTIAHGVGGLVVPGLYLNTGCHLALERRFSPSSFWQRVRSTKTTITLLFPAQLNLLLETAGDAPRKSSLHTVITHAYIPEFCSRFGVRLGTVWGSTEIGAHGAGRLRSDDGAKGDGYVGPPMGEEEIGIVDPTGLALPEGEIGEIRIRHRHNMLEYLKEPVATQQTLRDGWISCGDFGSLDADGSLRYRGRLKNMIKRSGENISPEEVESLLVEHPGVVESIVFGVPDRLRTEEVAAVVVLRDEVSGAELNAFISERTAAWKAPRFVTAVTEPFPRLPSGKIDRVSVQRDFSTESAWDRERGKASHRARSASAPDPPDAQIE